MAINLPTWADCTTEQHIRAGMWRYYRDLLAEADRLYSSTYRRWQSECAADGIDPELERYYYDIDKLATRRDSAQANYIAFASAY